MFQCSNVPMLMFQYFNVPIFQCSNVLMFKCLNVQIFKCQMFKCSNVQIIKCSNVLRHLKIVEIKCLRGTNSGKFGKCREKYEQKYLTARQIPKYQKCPRQIPDMFQTFRRQIPDHPYKCQRTSWSLPTFVAAHQVQQLQKVAGCNNDTNILNSSDN